MPKKPPAPRRFPASRTPRRAVLFCRASLPFPYFFFCAAAFAPRPFFDMLSAPPRSPPGCFAPLCGLPRRSFCLALSAVPLFVSLIAPPRFSLRLASRSSSLSVSLRSPLCFAPAPPHFPLIKRCQKDPKYPYFNINFIFELCSKIIIKYLILIDGYYIICP